jgi:hypothetical protein
MATLPVRGLGSAGIVTDTHPSDLENTAAFTAGVNVRFRNGRVSRAPVSRTITTLDFEPGHALAIPPSSGGFDEVVMVAHDFSSIKRLNGTALEDVTPTGQVGDADPKVITSCYLGGVSYLNRESHDPLFKTSGDNRYNPLANWPEGYKTKVLRAYKDQLIALGVTKLGAYFPTMVKWSDLTGFGTEPNSWDPTSTTNSAGENIVNEMQHTIVDGLALRNSFVIYCTNSVWGMDYVGGDFIFQWTKLFDERGVINPNCVVQVGGSHFVFDQNDIYVHDGITPTSIADAKTRDFIFDGLDTAKRNLCFVNHDARMSEIRFCYPSADNLVGFVNPTTGCNRAAVYNYSNGTWTFYDMPNVTGSARASLISGEAWETDLERVWDDTPGVWMTSDGDESQHVMFVGRADPTVGLTASRLYGFDLINGGTLTQPIELETLKPSFLERTGLDLDSIGKNLTQYSHVQALWPQMSIEFPTDAYWQFGANDLVNIEPTWSDEMTFDPLTESKLDINEAGKYLAYRFGLRGSGDFQLSGFDVQIVIRGRR